ncbi:glycosyltransferase family 2 protein [Paenibacillus ihumii]|uniref:glycosyltransferase family 2 protein n=1 Tax=Paenibacillus ihumii TaxID=687436 RepID=UPI000A4BEEAB|nr:glycosyltransferase family A protein [Paenibacillus ihumii]
MSRTKLEKPIGPRRSAVRAQDRSRRKRSLPLLKAGKGTEQGRTEIGELEQQAFLAGYSAASGHEDSSLSYDHLQSAFLDWFKEAKRQALSWRNILAVSSAYRRGYNTAAKQTLTGIPLPLRGTVSAVVSACNEERTIAAVISELIRLPFREIIVILNGCKDRSYDCIRRHDKVIVVCCPDRLGHDVARGIGASLAAGDAVLFTDGDIVLSAEDLAPLLLEIDQGADVVLNDISPYLPPFSKQDAVTRSKMFLNYMLGRPDLKANSLTAVPHALSRRAISAIGARTLIVPPKAQALAIVKGLKIRAPKPVDVVKRNRLRSGNVGEGNEVASLILGDHIEAFQAAMELQGARLGMTKMPRSKLARKRNGR